MTDVLKSLEETQAAVLASQPEAFQSCAFTTTDLTDRAFVLLSATAQEALQKPALTDVVVDPSGKTYAAFYLSVVTKPASQDLALSAICDDLNALADAGLIHSCLAPPTSLALAIADLQPMLAVFAIVLVDTEKTQAAQAIAGYAADAADSVLTNILGD